MIGMQFSPGGAGLSSDMFTLRRGQAARGSGDATKKATSVWSGTLVAWEKRALRLGG